MAVKFRTDDTYQYMSSSEQVAEGVVEKVDEGGSIQISIAHCLRCKKSLSGTTTEETSHHAVTHIHVMRYFLRKSNTSQDKSLFQMQHVLLKNDEDLNPSLK